MPERDDFPDGLYMASFLTAVIGAFMLVAYIGLSAVSQSLRDLRFLYACGVCEAVAFMLLLFGVFMEVIDCPSSIKSKVAVA
jgi:hypothetical protein